MSPIPFFDHNRVLPPYQGSEPTSSDQVSPYDCSIIELCHRFATSNERIAILEGFISFREKMTSEDITSGYQWLDGSFLEDIEALEKRPPKDIDVVTFYAGKFEKAPGIIVDVNKNIISNFIEFAKPRLAKVKYRVDNQPVDISTNPFTIIEATRFWIQLFTHRRNQVWKGILRIPINTPVEDQQALQYLISKKGTI